MSVIEKEWWEGHNAPPTPEMIGRWLVAFYYVGDEQLEFAGRTSAFKLEGGRHWALLSYDGRAEEWVDLASVEWQWLDVEEGARRAQSMEWVRLIDAVRAAKKNAKGAPQAQGAPALSGALEELLQAVISTAASHYACLVADAIPLLVEIAVADSSGSSPRLAMRALAALLRTPSCRFALRSEHASKLELLVRRIEALTAAADGTDWVGALCDSLCVLQNLALDPLSALPLLECSVLDRLSRVLSLPSARARIVALYVLHNLAHSSAGACAQMVKHSSGVLLAKVLQQLDHRAMLNVGPRPDSEAMPGLELDHVAPDSPLEVRRWSAALILALSARARPCAAMLEEGLLPYVTDLVSEKDHFLCQIGLAVLHNACSPQIATSVRSPKAPSTQLIRSALSLCAAPDLLVSETAILVTCQLLSYTPVREIAREIGIAQFFGELFTSRESALSHVHCQRSVRERAAHTVKHLSTLAPGGVSDTLARQLEPFVAGGVRTLDAALTKRKGRAKAGTPGQGRKRANLNSARDGFEHGGARFGGGGGG